MLNRCNPKRAAATSRRILLMLICVALWLPSFALPPTSNGIPSGIKRDVDLHKEAKKALFNKEWAIAIQKFSKIESRFPDSNLRVEALYWTAFSMEKLSHVPGDHKQQIDEKKEAIRILNQLLNITGNSPWIDDAQRLRIRIAADLVVLGKSKYKRYITAVINDVRRSQNEMKLLALASQWRYDRSQALESLARLYVRHNDEVFREKIIFLLRRFGETTTIDQLLDPKNRIGSVLISEEAGRMGTRIGHIVPPTAIRRVTPTYPKDALQEGITGNVVLVVVVDLLGYVLKADVEGEAHPLLLESAVKAVKQWRYRPYTYQGSRSYVRVKITFKFLLTGS